MTETPPPLPSGCPWCGPIPSEATTKICPRHREQLLAEIQAHKDSKNNV